MIKFGSLFSGIGAAEQALIAADIDHEIVYACDFDPHIKSTYKYNYPECQYFYDDITRIQSLPYVDLLMYGFPCQSFSLAGHKRGTDDPRGKLLFKALDLTDESHPRVVILENVYGFVTCKGGRLLQWTVDRLERMGYKVSYAILNARDFGIPHNRVRVFIVATDHEFQFPQPQGVCPSLKDFMSSCSDESVYVTKDFLAKPKVQRKLEAWEHDFMPCLTHTLSRKGSSSEYIRDVAATYWATGELRGPTVAECQRLFGFPDTFSFPDSISTTRKLNMFTNSMCVPVVQAIVNKLLTHK